MAGVTHTAAFAYTGTTTASSTDTITLTGVRGGFQVTNTGAVNLTFRFDYGSAQTPAVVGADSNYLVTAGQTLTVSMEEPTIVFSITSGATTCGYVLMASRG